jgi:hypothetical protein
MKRTFTLALTAIPLLVACATGVARLKGEAAEQHYADYAGPPVERFTAFDIDGWTPVSRDTLVIWNGANEAWLIKVWDQCHDLQFADHIGVTSTTRTVSRFEQVRVGRDRCPISEIRPIDVKHMRADRAAARAASK